MANGCNAHLAEAVRILCGLDNEDEYEYVDHDLRAGRKDQSRDDLQDFKVSHEDGWAQVRKIKVAEIGNPSQIFLRRAGPDGAEYNHDAPEDCHMGANIGHIAWQAYNSDTQWDERNAQIYARNAGRGKASMHFQTCGEDRFVIHPNGQLEYNGPTSQDGNGEYIPILVNNQSRKLRIE